MAFNATDDFKICGLCSQLVDESVLISGNLRDFLCVYLEISDDILPTRCCVECFKSSNECLRFKNACIKSMGKIQKKNAQNQVLGSKQDVKPVVAKTPKGGKAKPGPKSKIKSEIGSPPETKRNKILESLGLDPDKIDLEVSEGRSSRSQKGTPAPSPSSRASRNAAAISPAPNKPQPKSKKVENSRRASRSVAGIDQETPLGTKPCKVMIKRIDRQRAENSLKKDGVVKSTESPSSRKRNSSAVTVEPAAVQAPIPALPPPTKKLRKGYAYELVPVAEVPKVPPKTPENGETRSSFGRVRSNVKKQGYVYEKDDDDDIVVQDEDEDVPLKNKKQDSTPKNSNKKAKKPTPAKAAPPPPPPKPEVEVDDDDDDDTEEVFPTIGPYQCEICQVITDTKLEFVEHIKAKHKGIVDEEVLRSLESDIRKSKKKARKAELNGKTATNSEPPKNTNTPKPTNANKPARAGPASKTKPGPKSKAKPASKKKTPTKKVEKSFEFCDTQNKKEVESQDPFDGIVDSKMEDNSHDPLNSKNVEHDEPQVVMDNALHDEPYENSAYENGTNGSNLENSGTIDADAILKSWQQTDNNDHFQTVITQPVASNNSFFGF